MKFDPKKHHRRSIRLKGYDYAQTGAYFITICTQNRECLFGKIVDGGMWLNDAGQMVAIAWQQLPQRFPQVAIDAFIVMPNHLHGIIIITESFDVGAGTKPAPVVPAPVVPAPDGTRASTRDGGQPQGGKPQGIAPTV